MRIADAFVTHNQKQFIADVWMVESVDDHEL